MRLNQVTLPAKISTNQSFSTKAGLLLIVNDHYARLENPEDLPPCRWNCAKMAAMAPMSISNVTIWMRESRR
jgi:hypothetical protein